MEIPVTVDGAEASEARLFLTRLRQRRQVGPTRSGRSWRAQGHLLQLKLWQREEDRMGRARALEARMDAASLAHSHKPTTESTAILCSRTALL